VGLFVKLFLLKFCGFLHIIISVFRLAAAEVSSLLMSHFSAAGAICAKSFLFPVKFHETFFNSSF
jgi:hypothetical protein